MREFGVSREELIVAILLVRREMAQYRASESKREQFRRYLEKAGVLDSLTNVLVTLYEEPEKPNNALEFIKQHLEIGDPDSTDVESLRAELSELQHKYDLLLLENKELKNRLQQYEAGAEDGGAE
ncbi:c-Myc-binding protein-like [Trichomycterus rosablanca]|uniref:c-Myc-binding protein-like n=1 Tax=Trichomycterus rosablanca TaxID=2290929 RepID=UPI002F3578E3